ncbi:hypothetical protein C0995_000591 [Termitomyces sp. Mi166|nr:hypothetical protein C0995_000591 [Termitomyces sp. Mi166\
MSDSSTASASPPTESRRPSSPAPANEKRVSLACLRCRTKRARCSGDKPVCRACEKAKEECIWPSGRRRKRTRKEMEEEERRERLASSAADSLGYRGRRTPVHPTGWRQTEQVPVEPYPEPMSWEYPTPPWPHAATAPTSHPVAAPSSTNVVPPPAFTDVHDREYSRQRPMSYSESDQPTQDDQYYHRYQPGSSAPAPAPPSLNHLSLKLPGPHTSLPVNTSLPRLNSNHSPPSPARELEDMFDEIGLPYPHLYIPLLDTFFQTMSRHFPSINRKRIEERLKNGTMSAFFLNSQEMIIVLIHLPTTDVVTGLLLLAWATYGQNSESGLWQYSGMAIRMAMDLGLHEVTNVCLNNLNRRLNDDHLHQVFEPYLSKAHVTRARLLFWSLFVTDRILAFTTGRPPTIPEEIIEIPLPTDEDFVPDPARADVGDVEEPPQPTPFVHMVRLMVLCGRITTVLAGCRGETRTLLPHVVKGYPEKLKELQAELVQFYAELLDAMKWSVDAFKHQEARGHGDSFLTLHLWANAVLAVSFHPELQERPEGNFSPVTQNVERSTKLSLSSSRIIAECLVFADLFASHSYTNVQLTSPFAVQPIYVASLAFIYDMKSSSTGVNISAENKPNQTVDTLLSTLARQNLAVLTKALHRMEHYWIGISSVSDILEQHAAGLGFQRIDASRKARLPDLALPDNPPIFTNVTYTQRPPPMVASQAPSTLPSSMILDSGDTSA